MDIHERLVRIVDNATSPADTLRAAAEAIADDQRSDACGVFLRDQTGRLTLWVRFGEGLGDRLREAAEMVVESALARVLPDTGEGPACTLIAAPLLLHAEPIGALVVERASTLPYSTLEGRRLAAVASQIVGIIESARLIEAVESIDVPGLELSAPPQDVSETERRLRGTGSSFGIAIGAVVFRQAFPRELVLREIPLGAEPERERVRDAVQRTRNDLSRLQSMTASEIGEEQALVFGSHLLLLSDPALWERVEQGVSAGQSAATAIDRAFSEIARRLQLVRDPYLRDRVDDVEDLCSRILGHLVGAPAHHGWTPQQQLVVCRRMTASLVVELKVRGVVGIASELGGTTSHGLVLARALGIPAVTGVVGIMRQAPTGETSIIDGDEGVVILRPSVETLDAYVVRGRARERARTEFLKYSGRAATTKDGVRFKLQANVALGVDLETARDNGADGIGLYRTEFPFIVREGIPTVDEQVRIYGKAHEAFPAGPIAFRLLDVGGDKFVPTRSFGTVSDAFHGYRSIRVLFDYPHVLRDQVQAFAIAAGSRPVSILIPMVSSIEDLRRVKDLVESSIKQHPEAAGLPPPRFGVMIEVPAAVEMAGELAKESDFLSIGTNDLIQYSLVVDREDPRLATPLAAFHPAILRMVRRVVEAAHAAGKEVGVCGEMAMRPELAIALLALGVDSLSVTPAAIPELKQKLAGIELEPLKAAIASILRASTAAEVEQALRSHVTEQAVPASDEAQ